MLLAASLVAFKCRPGCVLDASTLEKDLSKQSTLKSQRKNIHLMTSHLYADCLDKLSVVCPRMTGGS